MGKSLDKKLSAFLRRMRGDQSYPQFSKKVGVAVSTLHRLEQGDQSITLRKLDDILQKLKCSTGDVFEK